jgi:serine/threonine protein kinase
MTSKAPEPAKPISMPGGAYAIAALGVRCEALMFSQFTDDGSLFVQRPDDQLQESLKELARALDQAKWSDENAAQVVTQYIAYWRDKHAPIASDMRRWILSHPNNPAAVHDCMNLLPPEEITIVRLLSRAGSQKVVFLASWQLTQRQVVLKRLIGPSDQTDKIIGRESQAHPLSMRHRNVIETHILRNPRGEVFLAEEFLSTMLDDKWRAPGVEEATNLLYDIANALTFLHDSLDLIHGDVKPDNIGIRSNSYVLLDFGICRQRKDFTAEMTATGSLRTRAPELLVEGGYEDPASVDMWALGATLYNAVAGRFPLFDFDEPIPRVSQPDARREAEALLAGRVQDEWDRWVDLTKIDSTPLRDILARLLARDPNERPSARDVVADATTHLSAFLRNVTRDEHFSPLEQLRQLETYLPAMETLNLMPLAARQQLQERLNELQNFPGWKDEHRRTLSSLIESVKA